MGFRVEFRVGFRVGFSNKDFFWAVFFFGGILLAVSFWRGFQKIFSVSFYTTYFVVLRCFQDGGQRGWHIGKGNILFNLILDWKQ